MDAATLLHPRVRHADGARIRERLTRGRRPGEIVPLATLTHELDGGRLWPQVGDWQAVTADLLQLNYDHGCDALGLGLPPIVRALVGTDPRSKVRVYGPTTEDYQIFGPAERIEVLVEIRHAARPGGSRPPSGAGERFAPCGRHGRGGDLLPAPPPVGVSGVALRPAATVLAGEARPVLLPASRAGLRLALAVQPSMEVPCGRGQPGRCAGPERPIDAPPGRGPAATRACPVASSHPCRAVVPTPPYSGHSCL
ncbi:hypothetical protein STENM327S_06153 [Streptomyces tendae]